MELDAILIKIIFLGTHDKWGKNSINYSYRNFLSTKEYCRVKNEKLCRFITLKPETFLIQEYNDR